MKARSLWEPWATLVRLKEKQWETRHYATNYRGPLLVCAAKGGLSKKELNDILLTKEFQAGLKGLINPDVDRAGQELVKSFSKLIGPLQWAPVQRKDLNFGKAVAIVNLTDCVPVEKMDLDAIGADVFFGNYSPGRFAWKLEMIRNDFTPFEVKGFQGWFEVPDDYINSKI